MDFLLKIKSVVAGRSEAGAVPAERRDTPRVVVPIDGMCLLDDDRAFSTTIQDVGLYGMRLEVPKPLPRGTVLHVKVARGQGVLALSSFEVDTIRCEALWSRKKPGGGHLCGVRYADSRHKLNGSWVKFIFQKFGINIGSSFQRRHDIRVDAKVPVTLQDGAGAFASGDAIDLGMGGLLVSSKVDFPERTVVALRIGPWSRLPALNLDGVVMRRRLARKGEAWLLGVAFTGASYEQSRLLTRYLLKVLQE